MPQHQASSHTSYQCSSKKSIYNLFPVWYHLTCPGDVAQLGERDNRTVEARGSSPLISTDLCHPKYLKCLANRKGLWYSIGTKVGKSAEQE